MIIAENYGFSPSNDGMTNSKCLQAAVDNGGDIYISTPGVYSVSEQIYLGDDTSLYFCAGAYLKREKHPEENGFVFINKGAYTRTYNKNIKISGLKLICNEIASNEYHTKSKKLILGLRAQLSFFYVKNLVIEDFECLDLPAKDYCIQICTFEDVVLERLRIEGLKDAVHFGTGSKFVVRHGLFRTFDDPIALNAHDYTRANPEMGWIEDGLIEDCYDLDADSTTGFFCRILAGSWLDWYEGMELNRSDTVVSNGRMYRVAVPPDGRRYISKTPPTHSEGTVVHDEIGWVMSQERVIYNCGCRNIHFKNIYLQKKRNVAFSIYFDNDKWSRSYYPESDAPVQENITFENIVVESDDMPYLLAASTPSQNLRFINCSLKNSKVIFNNVGTQGIVYPDVSMSFTGTYFAKEIDALVHCKNGVSTTLSVSGTLNNYFETSVIGDVKIKTSDINIIKK